MPFARSIGAEGPSYRGGGACPTIRNSPRSRRDSPMSDLVLWLDQLRLADLASVGGKNASLGEMIGELAQLGVSVPGGFATTAHAFRQFIEHEGLSKRIFDKLAMLDVDQVDTLMKAGEQIRRWVIEAPLAPALDRAIRDAYAKLCADAGVAD